MLLRRLGVRFRIVPSRVSEKSSERRPDRLVVMLAARKALEVARRHPAAMVLGADTIVYCRNRIIVKPRSRADSRRMIAALSGTWHRVYTGVALVLEGGRRTLTGCAVTRIRARRLSPEQVESLAGKHMDKAGGYAVQDDADPLIKEVKGDLDNAIGLPLRVVRGLLKKASTLRRPSGPPRRG
ncbi:MAG: Maf family protein [Elusimicrobia bacterium]|nr:Maf family protein [Elusimicrobiota bacterium]